MKMNVKTILAKLSGGAAGLSKEHQEILESGVQASTTLESLESLFGEKSKEPSFDVFAEVRGLQDQNKVLEAQATAKDEKIVALQAKIDEFGAERSKTTNPKADAKSEGGEAGGEAEKTPHQMEMDARRAEIQERKKLSKV